VLSGRHGLGRVVGRMKDSVGNASIERVSVSSAGLEPKPLSSREGLGRLPGVASGSLCTDMNCLDHAAVSTSMRKVDEDQQRLNRQFDRLNEHLPRTVGHKIVWLRKPSSRWVRLPIGILLVVASVFSFLPVLGLWMLPLGLMLLAVDVPFLRRPTGLALVWLERQWTKLAGWYRGKHGQIASSNPPKAE
jgi:hypothetical protein